MKYLIIMFLFICCSIHAQKIAVNQIYYIDNKPYSKDPFEKFEYSIVKVVSIKQDYVLYKIIKAWCCEDHNLSLRLDVFTDQVESYKRKKNK